ncbi:MAG: hypothetical protein PVG66_00660 [Chromatiales bacterium]|jgi:hypothetical protein
MHAAEQREAKTGESGFGSFPEKEQEKIYQAALSTWIIHTWVE